MRYEEVLSKRMVCFGQWLLGFTLVLLLASGIVSAKEIKSDLGYRLEVPDAWLILNDERVKRSPAFQSAESVDGIDKELWQQVKPIILSGNVEMYIRPVQTRRGAMDSVNVILHDGEIPVGDETLKEYCSSFPVEISAALGKPTKMYSCSLISLAGFQSLQLEFDGLLVGTRSMQVHFGWDGGQVLVFTATADNTFLPQMRSIFSAMMASLVWI